MVVKRGTAVRSLYEAALGRLRVRYTDSSAAYGYDCLLFMSLVMVFNQRTNCRNLLRHPDIGQKYQSGVRSSSQIDKLSEILVHRDEDPVL